MANTVELPATPYRGPSVARALAAGAAGLGLIALLGYGVFLLFLRGGGTLGLAGAFPVAVVAGVASFFSPCSIPLLPGYLGYYALVAPDRPRSSTLVYALSAAAGVAAFGALLAATLGVAGLGLAASFSLVGPRPSPATQGLRFVVGIT